VACQRRGRSEHDRPSPEHAPVGPVRWITLDNPPVNFLTTDILADLHALIREAEQDDSVRAIVLTGDQPGRYILHFSIPEIEQVS